VTPSARVQAAIEILDTVIAAARDNGPPADALVRAYFKTRRYAGSKDRRAVRELVFAAIRHSGEVPVSGRSAMIGIAGQDAEILTCFDGGPHGPTPVGEGEVGVAASLLPDWLAGEVSPLVDDVERPALLERAPLDLRAHIGRTSREAVMPQFAGAEPTPHSPWGLRLPPDSQVDLSPEYRSGLVEVQDEGSQLIALACGAANGITIIDLCAGAGGKTLALAAAAPEARIIACDTSRSRLAQLTPRAERAGAVVETRLLNMPNEAEALRDLEGQADVVLVDAPCSGSGTWRRNPEGRWRLTPDRLDRLTELQARVLDLAAPLVKPGGRLVYAVCSILSREGAEQLSAFSSRHSSFLWQEPFDFGRKEGEGRMLTPAHDGTDGFFVACALRSC